MSPRRQKRSDPLDRLRWPSGQGWILPAWLEQQEDPRAQEFVPRGDPGMPTNRTGRNWTAIGNVDSVVEAIVDRRGLVVPWRNGWSLDWWIGAEDRWHFPSREVTVRQALMGDVGVVETRMRVPGGDAVHRTYACRTDADDGRRELVVVEIENDSPNPFAVAFAVRPFNTEGLAPIERIELVDTTAYIDSRAGVLFAAPPQRMAGSTSTSDCAAIVTSGAASASLPDPLHDEAGLAQAAFLVPVAHRATTRVVMPLEPVERTSRRGRSSRVTNETAAPPVPSAEQVAGGWRSHVERGARFVVPDDRLQAAIDANQAFQLLLCEQDDLVIGPATEHRFGFREAAGQLAALDRFGFHDEVSQVVASFRDRQRADGSMDDGRARADANGAALWAMGHHWDLTHDEAMLDGFESMLAGAAHWIDRQQGASSAPSTFADEFWGLAGLDAAATLFAAMGESDAADDTRARLVAFQAEVLRSLDQTADRLGTAAIPARTDGPIDPGAVASLVACSPLGLLAADHPAIVATAEVIRDRFCHGPAFYEPTRHTGLATQLTLQLAAVELAAGDRRALERLDWMLGAATATWTWPEAVDPRSGGGVAGDGHHGPASAEFLSLVRSMLVSESPTSLQLCSMLPETWHGQGIEVHDAPTRHGRMSFAVRWHGPRPALLWDFEPHAGVGDIELSCPGLDPTWRTAELRGDALLAAPEGSEPAATSFS